MSRPFARLPRAQAVPGRCIRCPRNEDLIDLGADDINGYGVAYLCTVCLGELLTLMGVIPGDQHEQAVSALRAENDRTHERLAEALAAGNPGVTLIEETMKEFADGLDDLARAAVRRLAAGPAGGGDLPAGAGEPVEPADVELPAEVAGEPAGVDEVVPDVDARTAVLAELLGAGGDAELPADAAGAGDAAPLGGDDGGDSFALLYGDQAD